MRARTWCRRSPDPPHDGQRPAVAARDDRETGAGRGLPVRRQWRKLAGLWPRVAEPLELPVVAGDVRRVLGGNLLGHRAGFCALPAAAGAAVEAAHGVDSGTWPTWNARIQWLSVGARRTARFSFGPAKIAVGGSTQLAKHASPKAIEAASIPMPGSKRDGDATGLWPTATPPTATTAERSPLTPVPPARPRRRPASHRHSPGPAGTPRRWRCRAPTEWRRCGR